MHPRNLDTCEKLSSASSKLVQTNRLGVILCNTESLRVHPCEARLRAWRSAQSGRMQQPKSHRMIDGYVDAVEVAHSQYDLCDESPARGLA